MMRVKFKQIYYPRVLNVMNTSLPHISHLKKYQIFQTEHTRVSCIGLTENLQSCRYSAVTVNA